MTNMALIEMCGRTTFTSILLICSLQLVAAIKYRRVCYYTNWAQYRDSLAKFIPSHIEPSLCSHIHFAFAKLVENKLSTIEGNDVVMYKKLADLKNKNKDLKLVLSVGGYNAGNSQFKALVVSKKTRKNFVSHVVSFLRKYNFDGLDIDWEYPVKVDKVRFVKLIGELRQAFNNEHKEPHKDTLLLACAVPAGRRKIDDGYDVSVISSLVDYISVMAYDYHGLWDHVTGINAPFLPASYEKTPYQLQLNVKWTMKYWLSKGAQNSKLNLGLAAYGRGFTLANTMYSQPGANITGPCKPGQYLKDPNFLAYFELCHFKNRKTYHWMNDSKAPYIVNGDQWIGYDNPMSLKLKIEWLKEMQFGGVSFWSLDLDDFGNICGEGNYPLLREVNKVLGTKT